VRRIVIDLAIATRTEKNSNTAKTTAAIPIKADVAAGLGWHRRRWKPRCPPRWCSFTGGEVAEPTVFGSG
jgi:hypothetical protein